MSRIVLKISGEALKDNNSNVAEEKLKIILNTINILKKYNHKIAIVVGGGNYFRGRENTHMEVITRDTIGMLGTVMNALYIKDYLMKNGYNAVVSTPFSFPNLIKEYSDVDLINKYDGGDIIIFGGGVGMSGYSTDSGVILATKKLNSDFIIKMTNVDGVYDSDPKINKDAIKYDRLTFKEVIEKDLKVMDMYAIEEADKRDIKILVMNFLKYNELEDHFNGLLVGTEVVK